MNELKIDESTGSLDLETLHNVKKFICHFVLCLYWTLECQDVDMFRS